MNSDKKSSKLEIQEQINNLMSSNPSTKQIKKAKKLAMSKNLKLKDYKKKFCKKCCLFFTPNNSEIRIKNKLKIIRCKNCGFINRHKFI